MTLVTYQLRAGVTGGTVNQGGGQSFNIGVAIAAGGGSITVDDQVNPGLISALDASGAVFRSNTVPGTPVLATQIGALQGHQEIIGAAGQVPILGSDGFYSPGSLTQYDKDNGQAGMYLIPQPLVPQAAGLQMAAQMVRGIRFRPSRLLSVIKAEIVITVVAAGNDTHEFAIYQDQGTNNPVARVATTGIQSGVMNTSVQVHNIALACPCQPGITYYAVLSYSQLVGATAAKLASIGTVDGAIFQGQVFGPRFPVAELFQADGIVAVGAALPATLAYTATASAPLIILREN